MSPHPNAHARVAEVRAPLTREEFLRTNVVVWSLSGHGWLATFVICLPVFVLLWITLGSTLLATVGALVVGRVGSYRYAKRGFDGEEALGPPDRTLL